MEIRFDDGNISSHEEEEDEESLGSSDNEQELNHETQSSKDACEYHNVKV
jgi:hypothetical protein